MDNPIMAMLALEALATLPVDSADLVVLMAATCLGQLRAAQVVHMVVAAAADLHISLPMVQAALSESYIAMLQLELSQVQIQVI
jgi:hypothetical protein